VNLAIAFMLGLLSFGLILTVATLVLWRVGMLRPQSQEQAIAQRFGLHDELSEAKLALIKREISVELRNRQGKFIAAQEAKLAELRALLDDARGAIANLAERERNRTMREGGEIPASDPIPQGKELVGAVEGVGSMDEGELE
jgi:hypothetical protein